MRKAISLLAGAALLAISGTGHALTLDTSAVVGASPKLPVSTPILPSNDVGITGNAFFGQLTSGAGFVKFEYLGKEASFTNTLSINMGGTTVFTTGVSKAGDESPLYAVSGGLLDFSLCTSGGIVEPTFGLCVNNKNAASIIAQYNLGGTGSGYRSIGFQQDPKNAHTWLILWDDSGFDNDNDYDDLVARVYFTVPEPTSLALLGLGLVGLGFARRRRI